MTEGNKTSDNNAVAVRFRDNISSSAIWSSMMIFYGEIIILVPVADTPCLQAVKTMLLQKSVRRGKTANSSLRKLLTAVSCSCLITNTFTTFAKNIQTR